MDANLQVARNAKQLATALKRFRRLLKLTQEQVGESAGIPQTTVSKVEVGLVDPTLTTCFRILAALDLELVIRPRAHSSGSDKRGKT